MGGCCQRLGALSYRDGDSEEERGRKEITLKVAVLIASLGILNMVLNSNPPPQANFVGNLLGTVCSGAAILSLVFSKNLSVNMIGCLCFAYGTSACLVDMNAAAANQHFRPWTWVVLVMDMYLTLGIARSFQYGTLAMLSLWLVIANIEQSFRLGLFDVEHFIDMSSTAKDSCACADPPCAAGAHTLRYVVMVHGILYGDYFVTRRFAEGMRLEKDRIAAAVEIAEQVVASLARFDLAEAEQVLQNTGGPQCRLPKRLVRSFYRLVSNLSSYRPHLPQTCFEDGDDGQVPSGGDQTSQTHSGPPPELVTEVVPDSLSSSCGPVSPPPRDQVLPSPPEFWDVASSGEKGPGTPNALLKRCGHAPQPRRVTLLARNATGFLAAAAQSDAGGLGAWLAEEVGRFERTIRLQGGIADLIHGDHFFASFGALKTQGSQCSAATYAARDLCSPCTDAGVHLIAPALAALQATTAVCTGRALCGDFGSITTRRFMVVGGVSSFIGAVERVAAGWELPTLIDSVVHSECEQFWSCRLRKYVHFAKMETGAPIGLWEVLGDRMAIGENAEWMYDLANAKPNPWTPYNQVVESWCVGSYDQALGTLARLDTYPGGQAVSDALQAVREGLQACAAAPICTLDPAALAGDPSPLSPQGTAAFSVPPRAALPVSPKSAAALSFDP